MITNEQIEQLEEQAKRAGWSLLDYANLHLNRNGDLKTIGHLSAEQAESLLTVLKQEATAIETMDNERP